MIRQKRIIAGALGCILVCTQPAGYLVKAAQAMPQTIGVQEQELETLPTSPEDLQPDFNDPDYVKRMLQEQQQPEDAAAFSIRAAGNTSKSPFTGLTYTHGAQLQYNSIVHGIDVSKWQAQIDWQKVKAAGVKFVFIRCGYTSLSQTFAMYEDEYFRQNVQKAYEAGIKVGIYYFSNSITAAEARKEAAKTLELISGYKKMITLPVVFDFEAFSSSYRAYGTSKDRVTKNALIFMEAMEDAGFDAMYYSSPSFLNTFFDVNKLSDYDFWLANYTTRTSYQGDYTYWQYSSSGQVNGIQGNVDCNFYYSPDGNGGQVIETPDVPRNDAVVTGLKMTANTTDSISIQWNELLDVEGYEIYRSNAMGGTYEKIATITNASDNSYVDNTVDETEGRQYYYKVVPYRMEEVSTVDDPGVQEPGEGDAPDGTGSTNVPGTDIEEPGEGDTPVSNVTTDQTGQNQTGQNQTDQLQTNEYTSGDGEDKEMVISYGKESDTLVANTVCLYKHRLKTNTSLNLRSQAGTEYALVTVVPEGTKLSYKKYTMSAQGRPWYMVTYKNNGISYKGYLSGSYVDTYSFGETDRKMKMRKDAGTSYQAVKSIPKGTEVKMIRDKKDSSGRTWIYVRCTVAGKVYKGYVKEKFVDLI